MILAFRDWDRPSRRLTCWLGVLGLAISGCGEGPTEPTAPPPGVQVVLANPSKAKVKIASEPVKPRLHPGWRGTQEWTERETAVDALRRVGPSALPALVELLHGSDRDLRELSARAIALMGPAAKAAVPDLEAALSDLDSDVRKNVIRALGQMGADAESAIPALVQEIHRPAPIVETPNETAKPDPANFEPERK